MSSAPSTPRTTGDGCVDAGVGRQRPWLSVRKGAELRGDEEQQARRSPRRAGGCAGCAPPARARSGGGGSGRRGRRRRSGTAAARSAARTRSPSRGRSASRDRRSSSSPASARARRRASRRDSASRGRARPAARALSRVSPKPSDGPSGTVVSVSAGMPRATKGPCSPSVNGKPRSSSCRSAEARNGSLPDCSSTRTAAVRTSAAAGERAVSPAISSRGAPKPADRVEADHGDRVVAVRRALGEPRGSERTERAAVGRDEDERVRGLRLHRAVPAAGAYARASSMSAAVPEALSFAPCPSPLLSRCAVITILRCDAPSHDGDEIRQLDAPAARESAP